MACFVIGDIHGCFDELQELLQIMACTTNDQIMLLGDLTSKGPKGIDVLNWIIQNKHVECVLGNHDLVLLNQILNTPVPSQSSWIKQLKKNRHFDEIVDWLRLQPLIKKNKKTFFVHAGLHPLWTDKTIHTLEEETNTLLTPKFLKNHFNCMYEHTHYQEDDPHFWINVLVNMRYLSADSRELLNDYRAPNDRLDTTSKPWLEFQPNYSSDYEVIFGHWSMLPNIRYENFWCLDTGCVYGGKLTGMSLSDKTTFEVKSQQSV